MSSETFVSAAEVEFIGKKSCLVQLSLPNKLQFGASNNGISVLKSSSDSGLHSYFSVSYNDLEIRSSYKLKINGLYAEKLKIPDKSIVSLSILNAPLQCVEAFVQPISLSDWQIIQLHSNEVEENLMNEIRVVWPGQVFPIWVNNVCIYMKTLKVVPPSQCALLVNSSQIIVEDPAAPTEFNKSSKANPLASNAFDPRPCHMALLYRRFLRIFKYIWSILRKMASAFARRMQSVLETRVFVSSKIPFMSEKLKESVESIPDDFRVLFRVEPFDINVDSISKLPRVNCDQASTVVFHSLDMSYETNESAPDNLFLVKITKLLSPKEKKINIKNDDRNSKSSGSSAIVRLNVHEISKFSKLLYSETCLRLKVSSLVRRQLNLSSTSIVLMTKIPSTPKYAKDCLSKIVFSATNKTTTTCGLVDFATCFFAWLNTVSDIDHPLPLSIGSIVSFPCQYKLENDQSISNQFEFIVSDAFSKDDKSLRDERIVTFLLCHDDLKNVQVEFISSQTASCKSIDEVDFDLPENTSTLCHKHKQIAQTISERAAVALGLSPMTVTKNEMNLNHKTLLVVGPRGVGKTSISNAVMRELALTSHVFVHWTNCALWRGKRPDVIKGLLCDVLDELKWRKPSMLLLDNLDQLASSTRTESDQSYDTQIASIFKHELVKIARNISSKIFVLVTSSSRDNLQPTLLQETGCHLLSTTVEIPLPGPQTRVEIFKELLKKIPFVENIIIESEIITKKTEGFVAKDLVNISQMIVHEWKVMKQRFGSYELTEQGIVTVLDSYTPISLLGANLHKPIALTWADIGGLQDVRQQLTEQLMWPIKYSMLFRDCGLKLQTGILLYGEPGCGKTLLAGIVANECQLNFISVKGPELLNKYIGASEAAVRDLFIRASTASPCILFFDEFDSIAPHRGHDTTGVTDRVVNQLLTHLDGVEPIEGVYVMAATSRPDLIDLALLRPGRLDNHLHLSLPSKNERLSILRSLCRNLSLADDVNLQMVAENSEYFSGADLKALLYDAQLQALHDEEMHTTGHITASLSQDDFNEIYSITGSACNEYLPSLGREAAKIKHRSENIVHMPNLHTGIVDETRIPDRIKQQVDEWRRPQESHESALEEDQTKQKVVTIHQRHIEACLDDIKPSLSESERRKYKLIYDKFSGLPETVEVVTQRTTMA